MNDDRWPYAMPAKQAAEFCGMSPQTLDRLAAAGQAPAPIRLHTPRSGGGKRPLKLWLRRSLEDWLDRLGGRAPDAGSGGMTRRGEDRNALRPADPRSR